MLVYLFFQSMALAGREEQKCPQRFIHAVKFSARSASPSRKVNEIQSLECADRQISSSCERNGIIFFFVDTSFLFSEKTNDVKMIIMIRVGNRERGFSFY